MRLDAGAVAVAIAWFLLVASAPALFSDATTNSSLWTQRRGPDRASGDRLWSTSWPGAAVNGEWLFVAGLRDLLACLDTQTGDIEWVVDFPERFNTPLPAFGFACSPLVAGEHVYVQAGAALVKLDRHTGETVWRTLEDAGGLSGSAFSSPILASLGEMEQLVVQTRTQLAGVDPESGDPLWSHEIPAFRGMNILTPMVYQGAVFTATYGIEPAGDNRVQDNMTSPVGIGEQAYFLNRGNRFTCIDLNDGEIEWISGPTGDEYWSLVARGDRIPALSNTGLLRLIRANPGEFEQIEGLEIAEDETWAHLVVAGNQLFVREQFGLAAHEWHSADPQPASQEDD